MVVTSQSATQKNSASFYKLLTCSTDQYIVCNHVRMTKSHIHIIKMGGTIEFIDPAYDSFNTKLMKLDSSIESYLHNLIKPHFNFSSEMVTEKDSRDINEQDLEKLARAVESTPHSNIIITHGTFTMSKTASYLATKPFEKKIILTGSMIPIIGFAASDAGFNLGFVAGSFSGLQDGVYLSMNGGIFSAGEVEKNTDLFRFE